MLARGLTEDPSHLGTGGRVTSSPLPHPSLHTFVHQTNQRPGRYGHVRIPPLRLSYHGNEHWSRQHLAVVRRGGEGGRRGRKRQGKGREESRKRTNPSQEEEYLSDLQLVPFCLLSVQ